jgi:hypothetical protein
MSSLKVNQIKAKLQTMFESHLDLSDIGGGDPQREPKVLTRSLAALAVYLLAGCTEKDAASAVWDGADDNGIDAAYFDPSDSRVIFVQARWIGKGSGEPEAKEIGTFLKGVRDAVEQDATGFHARLQARFSDIALRLNTPGTSASTKDGRTSRSRTASARRTSCTPCRCLPWLTSLIQIRPRLETRAPSSIAAERSGAETRSRP